MQYFSRIFYHYPIRNISSTKKRDPEINPCPLQKVS